MDEYEGWYFDTGFRSGKGSSHGGVFGLGSRFGYGTDFGSPTGTGMGYGRGMGFGYRDGDGNSSPYISELKAKDI